MDLPPKCWPPKNVRELLEWVGFFLFGAMIFIVVLCMDIYDRLQYGKSKPIPDQPHVDAFDIIQCKDRSNNGYSCKK